MAKNVTATGNLPLARYAGRKPLIISQLTLSYPSSERGLGYKFSMENK